MEGVGLLTVSAGDDNSVRIWDANSGNLLRMHVATDTNAINPGHAVWNVEENELVEACGDIWRSVTWVAQDENGSPTHYPLESFGGLTGC